MEILKPDIINLDGRRYRRNPVVISRAEGRFEEEEWMESEIPPSYDEIDVEQTKSGFRISIDVPSEFLKFIIGKKGDTKRKIERETKTRIQIPDRGSEGDIVISGPDKLGVTSAHSRIEVLVESARMRQPWTHFLSIPLTTELVQSRFAEFKNQVLETCENVQSVDCTIFQNPAKLHLTIGTLKLFGRQDEEKAIELLRASLDSIIKDSNVIHLQGLEYMNDDPREVDVLYAVIHDSKWLQKIADELVDVFTRAGLMEQEWDRVKLHATLMNSKFRKGDADDAIVMEMRSHHRGRSRESFDAVAILETFKGFSFGDVPFETIHISERHSQGPDCYYTCVFSTKF
eukprot:m.8956 g.8956  ORF g.8956 m.8956 type:complete len:344 (+) comp20998_c0_seq2:30-1061(+)